MSRNKFDFTKIKSSTKPTMNDILQECIREVTERDIYSDNSRVDLVREENQTFYYRVIHLFMTRVSMFYTAEEVDEWMSTNLKEVNNGDI